MTMGVQKEEELAAAAGVVVVSSKSKKKKKVITIIGKPVDSFSNNVSVDRKVKEACAINGELLPSFQRLFLELPTDHAKELVADFIIHSYHERNITLNTKRVYVATLVYLSRAFNHKKASLCEAYYYQPGEQPDDSHHRVHDCSIRRMISNEQRKKEKAREIFVASVRPEHVKLLLQEE